MVFILEIKDAGMADIKRGYTFSDSFFTCLLCGHQTENGVVYPEDGVWYEAERSMQNHMKNAHGSVFESLIQLDKRWTGLSVHQCRLLQLFYEGRSDAAIQAELGIGSGATIRAHRFALKEKERQAKVFLAIMELIRENKTRAFASPSERKRSAMKKEGNMGRFFSDRRLITLDVKKKNLLQILMKIIRLFEAGRIYTEKEINEILKPVYEDYFALRRYLVDYDFLRRKTDGSQYWVNEQREEMEEMDPNRKKELINEYKQQKTAGGVYQLRNTQNGKIFIGATPNLKSVQDFSVTLDRCAFRSAKLKEDIAKYGRDAFEYAVLEKLEEEDDVLFDMSDEVKALEKKWLKKLNPYGENGYN